jgi:hypothetical protein
VFGLSVGLLFAFGLRLFGRFLAGLSEVPSFGPFDVGLLDEVFCLLSALSAPDC